MKKFVCILVALTLPSISFGEEFVPLDLPIPFNLHSKNLHWTPDKVAFVKTTLQTFIEKYPLLMQRVYDNGYGQIELDHLGKDKNSFTFASVSPFGGFQIDELSFNVTQKDQFSGYDLKTQILLHELIHGFDQLKDKSGLIQGAVSRSDETLERMGFDSKSCGEGLCPDDEMYKFKNIKKSLVDHLVKVFYQKRRQKGWYVAREFGRYEAMQLGFPTLYSMWGGPQETFAEIASHVALDQNVNNYLDKNVISWFQENVLK